MEMFQQATILGPRYKLVWCIDEEIDIIKSVLLKKAEEIALCKMLEEELSHPKRESD